MKEGDIVAKLIKENIINFFKSLFTKWIEDLFVFMGILIIVYTTYKSFGITVGNYSIGIILLYIGLILAKR